MREEVRQYLNSMRLFDVADQLDRAFGLFEKKDLEYQPIFEDIFRDDANVDSGITLQRILDATREHLDTLIAGYGITLTDDTPLPERIDILVGLDRLEDYEDRQAITDILNLEVSKEEIAVELLQLTTGIGTYELVEAIDIAEIGWMQTEYPNFGTPASGDDSFIESVKRFARFMETAAPEYNHTFMHERFKAGLKIGYDFGFYLQLLSPVLEEMAPREAAINFIQAYNAAEGINATMIPQHWVENSELLITDHKKIVEIQSEITTLLRDYSQYDQD